MGVKYNTRAPLPRSNPHPSFMYIFFIICMKYPRLSCLSLICILQFTKSSGVVQKEAIAAAVADMRQTFSEAYLLQIIGQTLMSMNSLIFSLPRKNIEEYGPNKKIVAK